MFHAEQMCPDSLCFYLDFATVCYPRIKTPHQRMMIRATSVFSLLLNVTRASLSLFLGDFFGSPEAAVGCAVLHPGTPAPTIDNLILVIPFGTATGIFCS